MPKTLSNVSCSRSAPLERSSDGPPPAGTECHVDTVEMDKDDMAYDTGGAYWGLGNPIFMIWHEHEDGGEQFVRASGKCEAMAKAKEKWPGITFPDADKYREELNKEIKELGADIKMMDGQMNRDIAIYWLFEICAMLKWRGINYPGYHCPGEPECTYEAWLAPRSTEALLYMAKVLDRYDARCKYKEQTEWQRNQQ